MADPAPPASNRPLKADPEIISVPAGQGSMLTIEVTEQAGNATFANTKQHVADWQEPDDNVERFANTKHNIALINDPKNGPRFTLTKKESGLIKERDEEEKTTSADDITPVRSSNASQIDELEDDTKTDSRSKAAEAEITQGPSRVSEAKCKPDVKPEPDNPHPGRPLSPPPAAEPPNKPPIDSAKTFIGPNGTYYDESWRWMDWCGSKRSWNWPAALSFGHWFAYRRLYGHAIICLSWFTLLTLALVNNIHAALVVCLFILTPVLIGIYANTLYFLVFRRAVTQITEKGKGSYDELQQQLAQAGGINHNAPWYMAGTMITGICLVLAATYFGRGELQVNIWPF